MFIRYAIEAGATDWADAERQISKATKQGGASSNSMTVSVKTKGKEKKRKAGEAVEEAYKEANREGGGKKKSKSGKHR